MEKILKFLKSKAWARRLFIATTIVIVLFGSYMIIPPLIWKPGCFSKHVSEAMVLNASRKPRYKTMAKERNMSLRSSFVSFQFILMEKLLYPASLYFDNSARPYSSKGSSFMCDEFVSMKDTPSLDTSGTLIEDLNPKFELKNSGFLSQLKSSIALQDYSKVATVSHEEVERLKLDSPKFNCLYRHFIESIGRIGALTKQRRVEASNMGLPDPQGIIKKLMYLHYFGFTYAQWIDHWAQPLQKVGIPILCNDVPEIPIPIEFEDNEDLNPEIGNE